MSRPPRRLALRDPGPKHFPGLGSSSLPLHSRACASSRAPACLPAGRPAGLKSAPLRLHSFAGSLSPESPASRRHASHDQFPRLRPARPRPRPHAPAPAAACASCGASMARYYCSICHLFDDEPGRHIYHCPFCNFCRQVRRCAALGSSTSVGLLFPWCACCL